MRKIISVVLSFGLLFQQSGLLYAAGEINLANYLSQARNTIVQPEVFQPARLRYISYDVASNDFKILLDKGNNVNRKTEKPKNEKTLEFLNSLTPKLLNSQTPELNESTQELFNYFLTGLALPNDTFWVNLRPDAPENIIDPILEKTDIGKVFLEADLQLKKDTASLTSPQNPEGKSYWDKLYKKAGELFGTENIIIPTITRPWIVPNEVIVRETEDSAYIYKATLKVMLEADYLSSFQPSAGQKAAVGLPIAQAAVSSQQYGFSDLRLKELNEYSSQIIRETIIPKLTKEVNSSKRYAKLRQVYYSLVLARWFKQKYSSLGSIRASEHQSPGASANSYISLIDSGNLANLTSQEPCDKQAYFQAYQKSFKDGEYNLKETVATPFGQSIRSYISGGIMTKGMKMSIVGSPVREDVTKALKIGLVADPSLISAASPLTLKKAKERADDIFFKIVRVGDGAASLLQKEDSNVREAFTAESKILDKIGEYYNPNTGEVDDFRVLSEALESIRGSIDSFLKDKRVNGIKEKTAYIMMNKAGKDLGGLIKDIDDEILGRLLLPPEFITARDEISRELQNVINSLEDSINPIKVKAEYRSRYFSFVTEAIKEIKGIHEGFEYTKDSSSDYDDLAGIINEKVVPVIDKLFSEVKVKLVNVRGDLDSARNRSDKLVATGYHWLEGVLKDIEIRVSEFNKRFALMRNKLSELSGHKEISAGSPIGVRLSQDLPDNIRYVKLGDLSESGFEYAKEILKGIFPGLEITANDTFIAKINWSGGIERILWADIGNVMVFVDTSMKSEISKAINKNISIDKKIRQRLAASMMIKEDANEYADSPLTVEEARVIVKDYADKIGNIISYSKGVSEADKVIAEHYAEEMNSKIPNKWLPKADEEILSYYYNQSDIMSAAYKIYNIGLLTENRWFERLFDVEDSLKADILLSQREVAAELESDLYSAISEISEIRNRIPSLLDHKDIGDFLYEFINTLNKENENNSLKAPRGSSVYDYYSKLRELMIKMYRKELAKAMYYVPEWFLAGTIPNTEDLLINNFVSMAVANLKDNLTDIVAENIKSLRGATIRLKPDSLYERLADMEEKLYDLPPRAGSPVVGKELVVYDQNGKAIEYLRFVSYDKDIKGKNRLMLKDIMDRLNTTALLSDSGRPVYQFTLDSLNLSGMYFAVELDDSGKVVELKGILRIVNGKRETLGGKNQEVINALKNKEKEIVSSAVVSEEGVSENRWGGIDLTDRALHIKLERVGSFASTPLLLPQVKNAQSLDLDKEFEQLEALASSGIVPNSHRLLELFTVCHYRGEFGERLTQIISCLKASSAIQEAEAIDSDEDFRLALMMPEVLS